MKRPAKKAAPTVSKAKAPSSRSRKASKAPTPEPEPASADEEDSDEEDQPASPPKRAKATARKRVVQSESDSSEEEMATLIKPQPAKAGTPPISTTSQATPTRETAAKAVTPAGDDSDSEPDDLLADIPKTPSTVPRTPQRAPPSTDDDDGDRTIRQSSPESSPDIPTSVLPPKTPSQRAPITVPVTPAPTPAVRPKPRLTIHKLVLVNFKSYAGRQEIGPFHKSFSSIVGPNGSGKSNTIDALLFVFGYRASKMRQGKLSELIHNSAGKEGIENCSVEVWFREIVDLVRKPAAHN